VLIWINRVAVSASCLETSFRPPIDLDLFEQRQGVRRIAT